VEREALPPVGIHQSGSAPPVPPAVAGNELAGLSPGPGFPRVDPSTRIYAGHDKYQFPLGKPTV